MDESWKGRIVYPLDYMAFLTIFMAFLTRMRFLNRHIVSCPQRKHMRAKKRGADEK